MNNEDTLYFNNEENPVQDEITNPIPLKTKKSGISSKAKVAVAGAAGVAAGTVVGAGAVGIAVAANQNHEEPRAELNETETPSETSETIAAEAEPTASMDTHTHVTHVTHNNYTTEIHNHPEPIAETPTEDHKAMPVQQELPVEPVADNEVRILGVETVHHPAGFDMDVVGIAVGDDPALLVDVNQDGYLDVLIHDDNKNGRIEDHEYHDIRDAELSMTELGIESEPHDFMASDEAPIDNFDDPNIMPV